MFLVVFAILTFSKPASAVAVPATAPEPAAPSLFADLDTAPLLEAAQAAQALKASLQEAAKQAQLEIRLQHARELLGKYYDRTMAEAEGAAAQVNGRMARWVRDRMSSASRKVSRSVTRAILRESKRYDLDPVFVASVIQTESSFNPGAEGTSGELGMMQLLPDTAEWIAKTYKLPWKGEKSLLDPVTNIRLGTAYLDFLRSRFDNHSRLYLSAYNMGPRNVERVRERNEWPKEYASRVMKHYLEFYSELKVEEPAPSPAPRRGKIHLR